MGQFNLPSSAGGQQHNQSYGIGLGAADAIAASAGAAQPASEELFSNAQPQHDDTEELFGMLLFSLRSDCNQILLPCPAKPHSGVLVYIMPAPASAVLCCHSHCHSMIVPWLTVCIVCG